MRYAVVNVSCGSWYPRGLARLTESLAVHGYQHPTPDLNLEPLELVAWSNCLPPGARPHNEIMYGFKPHALHHVLSSGRFDGCIWLDSSCYLVGRMDELFREITEHGAVFFDNGYPMGQWCSDSALRSFGLSRDESFKIPEVTSCCFGMRFDHPPARTFVQRWREMAVPEIFNGYHTNDIGPAFHDGNAYRGVGRVSDDPRVSGHRHDQTAASYLVHDLNMVRISGPRIFAYDYGQPRDPATCIVNRGM